MDVAALEQFAQHVAHLLADAEQADRAAFGGFVRRITSPSREGWMRGVEQRSPGIDPERAG